MDHLTWPVGFSIEAYGLRVGIRVNTPDVLPRLLNHLPFGYQVASFQHVERLYSLRVGDQAPCPSQRPLHHVYADADCLVCATSLEDALEALDSDLEIYVAEHTTERLFVHAGVVGWHGRAILIPGVSHSGKSSLVAAFVRAGASYLSDDFAPLDPAGRVHPYARPLALRAPGEDTQERVPVERLGGTAGEQPLPVGLVLVTQYKPDACWRPRTLTPGQGLLALLANTVPARRQPEQALSTLRGVVSTARVLKSSRGEADAVVATVLRRLVTW